MRAATARAGTPCARRCSELQDLGWSRGARTSARGWSRRSRAAASGSRSPRSTNWRSSAPSTCGWCSRSNRSSPTGALAQGSSAARAARAGCGSRACAWSASSAAADRLDRRLHRPGLCGARRAGARVARDADQHPDRGALRPAHREIVQEIQAIACRAAMAMAAARRRRFAGAAGSCAAISMPRARRSRSPSRCTRRIAFSLTMRLQRATG